MITLPSPAHRYESLIDCIALGQMPTALSFAERDCLMRGLFYPDEKARWRGTHVDTSRQIQELLDAACEAARRAAVVVEEWRARFQVREKAHYDLVTDADLASQRVIYEYLGGRFPKHAFLGEEDAAHRRP